MEEVKHGGGKIDRKAKPWLNNDKGMVWKQLHFVTVKTAGKKRLKTASATQFSTRHEIEIWGKRIRIPERTNRVTETQCRLSG